MQYLTSTGQEELALKGRELVLNFVLRDRDSILSVRDYVLRDRVFVPFFPNYALAKNGSAPFVQDFAHLCQLLPKPVLAPRLPLLRAVHIHHCGFL